MKTLVKDYLTCPLCLCEGEWLYRGLRDVLFYAKGEWSLYFCDKCMLAWVTPRPAEQDMINYYKGYMTHSLPPKKTISQWLRWESRELILPLFRVIGFCGLGRYVEKRKMFELAFMGLLGEKPGRLLDVGCGAGYFLRKMMRMGWVVEGVEPDGEAAQLAFEETGAHISSSLHDVSLGKDKFDAITLNNVIEHSYNPQQILGYCYGLLKKNGVLTIRTPNLICQSHRWHGADWRGLEPPRHLWLFSIKSIIIMIQEAGFRIDHFYTHDRSKKYLEKESQRIRGVRLKASWAHLVESKRLISDAPVDGKNYSESEIFIKVSKKED